MTREEKSIAIEDLTAQLAGTNIVYVADISGLNAETTSKSNKLKTIKAKIPKPKYQ